MECVEISSCPCCGGREVGLLIGRTAERLERFRELSQKKYGGFMDGWEQELSLEVVRCEACGHLWFSQQPDQRSLFGMYAHGRRLRGRPQAVEPSESMLVEMSAVYRLVARGPHGASTPSLLDFGCGAGRWSRAARQSGFDVMAFEPTMERTSACDEIRWCSSMNQLGSRYFDVINLEQVLEHVPAPVDVLNSLRPFAHPDTVVRLSVPDVDRHSKEMCSDFPFNGQRMHILSPFEHLNGFCACSFGRMLDRAGMETIGIREAIHASPTHAVKHLLKSIGLPWSRTTALVRFAP